MRRYATLLLSTALLSAGATSAAVADTPRCVSRHEYGKVATGMSMTRVHKIFDTAGTKTGLGAPNSLYYYDTCTGRGVVQVIYNDSLKVVSKNGRFF